MIHLHVRDDQQMHTLDVDRYRSATAAIRARLGDEMIIQVTTEALGIYSPDQQIQMVRDLRPEAVSLAVRELCPEGADERASAEFFHWLQQESIAPQYVLYSPEDVQRFDALRQRGIIPADHRSVLYVLGRYSASGDSDPDDILPMMDAAGDINLLWSVCAFGASEYSCMLKAAQLGGHCRVGFENNMTLNTGEAAPDNQSLVAQLAGKLASVGRQIMSPGEARQLLGIT
jgi:uncharacterized protein (DUF849 family)